MHKIDNVIDFIWQNYPELQTKSKDWEHVFNKYHEGLEALINLDKVTGACYYYRLNHKHFRLLKKGLLDLLDSDIVMSLLNNKGRNIHFVILVANGFDDILKLRNNVIKKEEAKTVSWFDPVTGNLNIFKTRR